MTEKIKFELALKTRDTRTCLICDSDMLFSGRIQCECRKGDFEGLLICETCLKEGNFDERLEAHAARLEASAARMRQLLGRIVTPSYESWEALSNKVRDAYSLVQACEAHIAAVEDELPF